MTDHNANTVPVPSLVASVRSVKQQNGLLPSSAAGGGSPPSPPGPVGFTGAAVDPDPGPGAGVAAALVPGSFGEIEAADAELALAQALVRSGVQFDKRAVREALFLELYLGAPGRVLTDRIVELKQHQNTGFSRKLKSAIEAISLHKFMGRLNINLGGK